MQVTEIVYLALKWVTGSYLGEVFLTEFVFVGNINCFLCEVQLAAEA
jgi:hypothetical protein